MGGGEVRQEWPESALPCMLATVIPNTHIIVLIPAEGGGWGVLSNALGHFGPGLLVCASVTRRGGQHMMRIRTEGGSFLTFCLFKVDNTTTSVAEPAKPDAQGLI